MFQELRLVCWLQAKGWVIQSCFLNLSRRKVVFSTHIYHPSHLPKIIKAVTKFQQNYQKNRLLISPPGTSSISPLKTLANDACFQAVPSCPRFDLSLHVLNFSASVIYLLQKKMSEMTIKAVFSYIPPKVVEPGDDPPEPKPYRKRCSDSAAIQKSCKVMSWDIYERQNQLAQTQKILSMVGEVELYTDPRWGEQGALRIVINKVAKRHKNRHKEPNPQFEN